MTRGFNLTDPEGLAFDDQPHLFVLLDQDPIVWTVRGLAYFNPRFRWVGIAPSTVLQRADFFLAHAKWLDRERSLLLRKIEAAAISAGTGSDHYRLLKILNGVEPPSP